MGGCFSSTKISGSNKNTPSTASGAGNNNNHQNKGKSKLPFTTKTTTSSASSSNNKEKKKKKQAAVKGKQVQEAHKPRDKTSSTRRQCGAIPCGKRTDFGYDKDFEKTYTIGKLLGHGQFGYTYVATDKTMANGLGFL